MKNILFLSLARKFSVEQCDLFQEALLFNGSLIDDSNLLAEQINLYEYEKLLLY